MLVAAACGSGDSDYEVLLEGLNEPRGMWILADGSLCVAEAGRLADGQEPSDGSTANRADTGSVSCVDQAGARDRIIERLPYVLYSETGVTAGPSDVAEMGGELYLLTGEGQGPVARKLLKITDPAAPPEIIADLLAFSPRTQHADIFPKIELSNPFAMIPDPSSGGFLVSDAATGLVLTVELDGAIRIYSVVIGHEVLTGIVRGPNDLVYVASFSELPHEGGDGAVVRIDPQGSSAVVVANLTTPIDLAFDTSGFLYVLEFTEAAQEDDPYRDKTGRLVRFSPEGDGWFDQQVVVEGLPFPTALLIDGDDQIYVSVHGAFSAPGSGQILQFTDLANRKSNEPPIQFLEKSS